MQPVLSTDHRSCPWNCQRASASSALHHTASLKRSTAQERGKLCVPIGGDLRSLLYTLQEPFLSSPILNCCSRPPPESPEIPVQQRAEYASLGLLLLFRIKEKLLQALMWIDFGFRPICKSIAAWWQRHFGWRSPGELFWLLQNIAMKLWRWPTYVVQHTLMT